MTLTEQISMYRLGFKFDADLPSIGLAALEEGYDSKTLRTLAGRAPDENRFLLNAEFELALSEIGFKKLSRHEMVNQVLGYLVVQIRNDVKDSYTGFREIESVLDSLSFWSKEIRLEKAYQVYIVLSETISDGLQMFDKSEFTKEAFIDVNKQKLRWEIIEWWSNYSESA